MDRDHNGFLSDFERDADGDGIPNMDEGGSKDEARITTAQPADDPNYYDYGLFTPVLPRPRAEADRRTTIRSAQGINQVPFYCTDKLTRTRSRRRRSTRSTGCRPTPTATASATTRTTRPRRRPEHHGVPAGDRHARSRTASYRQLDACVPELRLALLPARQRRRRRRRHPEPRRHRRRRRRPARHARADARAPTRCAPTATATASRTATSTGPRSTSTAPLVPSRARRPTPTRSTAPTPTWTSTATASPSRRSTRPGTTPVGRSR